MPDTLNVWITGLSVPDAVHSGKWRSLNAVKPARSAKVVALDELRLSIQTRESAFPGMASLTVTGSRQLTMMADFTYQAFGHAGTPIVSTLTTSKNSDSVSKTNLRRL